MKGNARARRAAPIGLPLVFVMIFAAGYGCALDSHPDFVVSHFEDPGGTLSKAEVESKPFQRMRTTSPNFRASSSAHWFRLEFRDISRWDWLEVDYAQLDRITVFHQTAQGLYHAVVGDSFPFRQRLLPFPTFYFPLSKPRKNREDADPEVGRVLVQVKTSGPIMVPFRVHTEAQLRGSVADRNLLFGSYFGLLLIMALYNLLLYFSIKDRAFLSYAFYVTFLMLGIISLEGYGFAYLWPDAVWWQNRSFTATVGVSYFFAVRFSRRFLALEQYAKRLNRALGAIGFVILAIEMVPLFGPYRLGSTLVNLAVFAAALLLLAAGIFSARAGHKPALIFLVAWSVLLAGTIVQTLAFTGFLPPDVKYTVYAGSALEALLISLGLGYRFRVLQDESVRAQAEALERQRTLTSSYARFVPTEFLKFLGKEEITDVRLGDAVEREMTVLFSDIRSYTTLSEQMSPTENFDFLNAVLRRTGPMIRENNGFIDKYIGDSIMALFPGEPEDAVKAAIGMRRLLAVYNERRATQGYSAISMGIGINTGNLILGTIGEEERMEGTVISDAVNLASRLEGLTKVYGAAAVMSEQTLFRLSDPSRYRVRILDRVKVKGKSDSVAVFEILDGEAEESVALKLATQRQFERGISSYQMSDFAAAGEQFRAVLAQNPGDVAAALYVRRCELYAAHGAPPEWEGVEVLDSK